MNRSPNITYSKSQEFIEPFVAQTSKEVPEIHALATIKELLDQRKMNFALEVFGLAIAEEKTHTTINNFRHPLGFV